MLLNLKNDSFCGYVKHITKIMLGDARGTVVATVQVINIISMASSGGILHMIGLDVDSLYRNILLNETINIWTMATRIPLTSPGMVLRNILNIATKE